MKSIFYTFYFDLFRVKDCLMVFVTFTCREPVLNCLTWYEIMIKLCFLIIFWSTLNKITKSKQNQNKENLTWCSLCYQWNLMSKSISFSLFWMRFTTRKSSYESLRIHQMLATHSDAAYICMCIRPSMMG